MSRLLSITALEGMMLSWFLKAWCVEHSPYPYIERTSKLVTDQRKRTGYLSDP